MKKVLLISVAVAATFALVSCKKCVTCSYEYNLPVQGNITVPFPQECGTSKQNKVYKDNAEAEANRHGVNSTCVENK